MVGSCNRVPQIRLTQKFAGDWTVAGAICKPYDPSCYRRELLLTPAVNAWRQFAMPATSRSGRASLPRPRSSRANWPTRADLWGKAPFYGRPRGFTAQLTGGWQRTRYQSGSTGTAAGACTFGQNSFGATTVNSIQSNQQYLDPWCIQGTLFIPVLPTYSNNLAGSASITAQYFIGQGVSFLGAGRDQDNTWFDFTGIRNADGTTQFTITGS